MTSDPYPLVGIFILFIVVIRTHASNGLNPVFEGSVGIESRLVSQNNPVKQTYLLARCLLQRVYRCDILF